MRILLLLQVLRCIQIAAVKCDEVTKQIKTNLSGAKIDDLSTYVVVCSKIVVMQCVRCSLRANCLLVFEPCLCGGLCLPWKPFITQPTTH